MKLKLVIMKMNLNFLKYAFAGIFLFAAADAFSQFVPDTVVTQPDEVQVVTQQQKINGTLSFRLNQCGSI